MSKEHTPIGQGGMGRTYEIPSQDGKRLVEKQFAPTPLVEIAYRLLYQASHHPYSPENPNFPFAHKAITQRRHLAATLSRLTSSTVSVLDAEPAETGLRMPFVEGHPLSKNDKTILPEVDQLARSFREMGMPSWNLRGTFGWIGWSFLKYMKNGFDNVLVTPEGKGVAVDYEEGIPVPDRQWGLRFDDICHPTFNKWLEENREKIVHEVGEKGFQELVNAAKIERRYWESFRNWENSPLFKSQTSIRALKPIYLSETIDWLLEIGNLSPEEATLLKEDVNSLTEKQQQQLREIAPHLIVHNLTRLLPHGFASVARFTYTLGAKTIENLRTRGDKKHTWIVAIASLIPTAGGFAYLVDLIPTHNPTLTRLALESIAYHAFHTNLDDLIEILGKRRFSRKAVAFLEKTMSRATFVKKSLSTASEEQFGKEIVEEVVGKFVQAAKSKPEISDNYPTQLYHNGKMYFINWKGNKVIKLDPVTHEEKKVSPQKTRAILDLLRQASLGLCEDYKKTLTTQR